MWGINFSISKFMLRKVERRIKMGVERKKGNRRQNG
jgi:hypothetical protein